MSLLESDNKCSCSVSQWIGLDYGMIGDEVEVAKPESFQGFGIVEGAIML